MRIVQKTSALPLGSWPDSTLFVGDHLRIDDHAYAVQSKSPTEERQTQRFQIVLPRVGGWMRHVEGSRHWADPVTAVFYNPGDSYRYEHHARRGRCTYLILSDEAAGELVQAPRFGATHRSLDARLLLIHRAYLDLVRRDPKDALAIEELGLILAWELARPDEGGPAPPKNSMRCASRATVRRHAELAEALKHLLARRLAEPHRLADLAESLACSPFHLARVFRAQTGSSIQGYLRRLRLARALEGLQPGCDTTDLALAVGFSSRSHFSDAFRTEFGCRPSEVRAGIAAEALRSWLARDREGR